MDRNRRRHSEERLRSQFDSCIPDLVCNSKVETRFHGSTTIHTYPQSSPGLANWDVSREEHWCRTRQIGNGASGYVWQETCVEGQRKGRVRAVKQIPIIGVYRSREKDYKRELEAIAKFSHEKYEQRFVQSDGWYEGTEAIYISMEYFKHGDLQHYMIEHPPFEEDEAKVIVLQIVGGLCFMHDNGFVHRDLKPRNILIASCPPNTWWVKIGDFGISKRIEDERGISSSCRGTEGYMAPELHDFVPSAGQFAVDIWSLGEMTSQMLTKVPTFKRTNDLLKFVNGEGVSLASVLCKVGIGGAGQDFVQSAMAPDPCQRLTATSAFQHAWLQQIQSPTLHPVRKDSGSIRTMIGPFPDLSPPIASTPKQLESSYRTESAEAFYATNINTGPKSIHRGHVSGSPLDNGSEIPYNVSSHYDREKGLVKVLRGHSGKLRSIEFSHNGRNIVSSSFNGSIALWDIVEGRLIETDTSASPCYAKFGSDTNGDHIFSVNDTGVYCVRDGYTLAPLHKFEMLKHVKGGTMTSHAVEDLMYSGHTPKIDRVVFSSNGRWIALTFFVDVQYYLRIWDTKESVVLRELQLAIGQKVVTGSMRFSHNDFFIAVGSSSGTIFCWQVPSGRILLELTGLSNSIYDIAFSPDGETIAATSHRESLRLWDILTRKSKFEVRGSITGHVTTGAAIDFSPDSKVIARGSFDGSIRLFDTASGALLRTIPGLGSAVRSLKFSPDGCRLVSAFKNNCNVYIWDARTISERLTFAEKFRRSCIFEEPQSRLFVYSRLQRASTCPEPPPLPPRPKTTDREHCPLSHYGNGAQERHTYARSFHLPPRPLDRRNLRFMKNWHQHLPYWPGHRPQ